MASGTSLRQKSHDFRYEIHGDSDVVEVVRLRGIILHCVARHRHAVASTARAGFMPRMSWTSRAISRAAGVCNSNFFRLIPRNVKLYRKIVVGVNFWRRLTGTGVNYH